MSDDIQETPSSTPNFKTELAKKLQQLVPEAIADGKVDVTKLKELLGDDVDDGSERFGLFWPGKMRAIRAAQEPTTATLTPEPELSKNWDTTSNVFIEGDNLEALKILQKHYHGKIKMIYIDPPYNTGKDFIYPDNYREGLQTYLEWTKQVNEEGRKVKSNTETDGRYHSHWLNMMYPRLKLARGLLRDDGVIFISIDSHEISHLRRVCDEIFGESCFKNMIAVRRGIKNVQAQFDDVDSLASGHEYILLYSRRSDFRLPKLLFRHDSQRPGKWDTFWRGTDRPTMRYELLGVTPKSGQWRWESERAKQAVDHYKEYLQTVKSADLSLDEYYLDYLASMNVKLNFVRKNEQGVVQYYVPPSGGRLLSDNWMDITLSGSETKEFDTEKSVMLISRMIGWITDPRDEDAVLDFFSGSATTAHAVMQLNAEDSGNRHHIQVQLPEPVDPDSPAGTAGFKTIADIARKRIDLAGDKIKQDYAEQLAKRETPLDVGYRTYKLTDTNFSKWRETSDTDQSTLEQDLLDLRDSADDDATELALLTEVLLKQGYSLSEQVQKQTIAGLEVWSIGEHNLALAYMNELVKPTLDQLRALVNREPERLIILEDAFQGDDELKTNLVQAAKTKRVELWAA